LEGGVGMANAEKTVTIYVGGEEHEWEMNADISFEQVIELMYGSYDPNRTYSVSYKRGGGDNHSFEKDDKAIKAKEGLRFKVTDTSES
jgi:hypothetical protein